MRELPLSALQQRFWDLCTAYPGDASPILFLAWRMRGPLDVKAWCSAVSAVVDRHESLRTGFAVRDGSPVQLVLPQAGIDTELIDIGDIPEAERETRADELVVARTHRLLDLVTDPLVGSTLVRLADDDHVWCFTMHHLLSDGASLGIVSNEIRQTYLMGTSSALPELKLQYGDFVEWQHRNETAEAADLAYWKERLSGVPPINLPTDHPRPQVKAASSAELIHHMGPELAKRVIELSRSLRCTPFMVLLAGLNVLLRQWSGQDDFCVGTPVAGRVRTELEAVVGLFANTLALRTDLTGDPTFAELLKRTRATVIGALQRQTVPFGRIIAALGVPRDPSRTQVFQVIFSMRNDNQTGDKHIGDLLIEDFPHGHPKVLHDLVVDIWRLDGAGVRTGIRYDTALFSEPTIVALAQRYENLLSRAVADPGVRVSGLAAPDG